MKGSLTATTSTSGCSTALRKTIRPIRPNPLMPTLTIVAVLLFVVLVELGVVLFVCGICRIVGLELMVGMKREERRGVLRHDRGGSRDF